MNTGSATASRPAVSPLVEAVLAAIAHPLIAIDGSDTVLYANPPAEQFLETSEALLRRQKLGALLPFASPVAALVEQVREEGVSVSEYAVDIDLPRLPPRTVDMHLSPLADVSGGVLLMFQERAIARAMNRQIGHRDGMRSLTSMAAVLAHEIKNPLAGIRGAAQLIEQNAGEADRVLTRLICTETERVRKLVDRMEVFTDRRPVEFASVNIHEVLDHVKHIARSGFARHIAIAERYDPSLPPVGGDRDRLIQVFLNLVKNAADAVAGREGGEIVLQTAFRPGVHLALGGPKDRLALPLEVSVRDNGPGVSEALRTTLFEPFVSGTAKGQGLGLAIVAKIVTDHGGAVEFETGRQTVFRVRLPLYRSRAETA